MGSLLKPSRLNFGSFVPKFFILANTLVSADPEDTKILNQVQDDIGLLKVRQGKETSTLS
jgi:hypothetical protein